MTAFPFIPDSPFVNSCAQSTAVAWNLGKAIKLFDVHVFFYKHYAYKRIQAQVWKWFFIDKPSLYFLCSFYWYFSKIFWWFYFNEIYNCCVFASLPVYHFGWNLTAVYYFGWNLTASSFISPSPSIWNSRVHSIKTCSQWRVFLYYIFL